ncbi:hypothetical protein [Micromonospora sp. NPDC047074]|uniref:hypothetical protein n=1 Tax=Micromonospora sp. NPDC047074 TaxID=3154339 RepID=UPI0033C59DE7
MRWIPYRPPFLLGTTFSARLLAIGHGLRGPRAGLPAARRIQTTRDATELLVHTEHRVVVGLHK